MNNWMKLWFMEIIRKNDSNLILNLKSVSIQILLEFSSKKWIYSSLQFTYVDIIEGGRGEGSGGFSVYSYLLMFRKFRTTLFSHLKKGHFWKFCQKIITPGPTPFLSVSCFKVFIHKSLFPCKITLPEQF